MTLFNIYGLSFLLHPYFCPFLLLINNEAVKNIAYTRTLGDIILALIKQYILTMKNKNLFFVLYGASGSGKSTILDLVKSNKGCSIHQKDTTRPSRENESSIETPELRFQKKLVPANYAFIYKQYGYFYGVRSDLLEKATKNHELHFIIINDIKAIKQFKNKFPQSVVLYVHCDPIKIPERIMKRDGLVLETRKKRMKQQYLDFIKNNTLFDFTIINLWDIESIKKQIFNIIDLYKNK
jgi:guanylate kinase